MIISITTTIIIITIVMIIIRRSILMAITEVKNIVLYFGNFEAFITPDCSNCFHVLFVHRSVGHASHRRDGAKKCEKDYNDIILTFTSQKIR